MLSGVFNIDKPAALTSHDVVAHIRRLLRSLTSSQKIKVGHTGTLDPFATGVLLVTVGAATRLSQYTLTLPKTYRAEITLGATSTTDDLTGIITPHNVINQPSQADIQTALSQFTGELQQIPPTYAAIKIAGKKLYEYAREGKEVVRPPRPVTIYTIQLLAYEYPRVTIEVSCSSGTYIRALARDIGDSLGSGGYLTKLVRTAIGSFAVADALPLTTVTPDNLEQLLQPPAKLVEHLPVEVRQAPKIVRLLTI